jgi:hypothetical protein
MFTDELNADEENKTFSSREFMAMEEKHTRKNVMTMNKMILWDVYEWQDEERRKKYKSHVFETSCCCLRHTQMRKKCQTERRKVK